MRPARRETAADGVYVQTTRGIKVSVYPLYLPEQSSPEDGQYVWAYTIHLVNSGRETAQLIDRHWRITDATGQTQAVDGPGVVGEQPILEPAERFQYTSGTVLPTSSGLMVGTYDFVQLPGRTPFSVAIPPFSLDSPDSVARPN